MIFTGIDKALDDGCSVRVEKMHDGVGVRVQDRTDQRILVKRWSCAEALGLASHLYLGYAARSLQRSFPPEDEMHGPEASAGPLDDLLHDGATVTFQRKGHFYVMSVATSDDTISAPGKTVLEAIVTMAEKLAADPAEHHADPPHGD